MFSLTSKIKQFFHLQKQAKTIEKNIAEVDRDTLRYSEDVNQKKDDDQDSLKYTEFDDNQTINYDWLQQKLEQNLSQILQQNQKKQYRISLQIDRQKMAKIQQKKTNRKNLFQKYKKGIVTQPLDQPNQSIQKSFDTYFAEYQQQSFASKFLRKQNIETKRVQEKSQNQQNQKRQGIQVSKQKYQQLKFTQSQIIDASNSSLQKINSLVIQENSSQDKFLQTLLQQEKSQKERNSLQQPIHIENQLQLIQQKQKQKQIIIPKSFRQQLGSVIIRGQNYKKTSQQKNEQKITSDNYQTHLNFNYVTKSKQAQNTYLSKKPKINFQYGLQKQNDAKDKHQHQKSNENNKFKVRIQNHRVPVIYLNSMTQQRIPIFMQRLRRMNCYIPNLNRQNIQAQTVLIQFKNIIQNISSALNFLELLHAKIVYKIQTVKNFHILFRQNPNSQDSLQYFLKGEWKQIFRLTQIQYVKPKQRFAFRPFIESNFTQGIKNFRQNCKHYLNYPFNLQTKGGKDKYLMTRQIFFSIQINIKTMSEDLYNMWLQKCHFPYSYKMFYNYLKEQSPKDKSQQQYQNVILGHLIQLQDINDPLSRSIIGKAIKQKVQSKSNKVQ